MQNWPISSLTCFRISTKCWTHVKFSKGHQPPNKVQCRMRKNKKSWPFVAHIVILWKILLKIKTYFCNLSFNATFLMVTILAKKSWPFVVHTVILWKILLKISQNHVCLWYGQLLLILTSPTLLRPIHTFSSEFWNQKSSLKNWLQPARVTSFPLEFLIKWYQNDV